MKLSQRMVSRGAIVRIPAPYTWAIWLLAYLLIIARSSLECELAASPSWRRCHTISTIPLFPDQTPRQS
jgi:hypothetical protein